MTRIQRRFEDTNALVLHQSLVAGFEPRSPQKIRNRGLVVQART
jgi:hypothetical protein